MRKFLLVLTLILGAALPAMAALDADTIAMVRAQAARGSAGAQSTLGTLYENGDGMPRNYLKAAKWYRRAAQQGYGWAQYRLGVAYLLAEGCHGTPSRRSSGLAGQQRRGSSLLRSCLLKCTSRAKKSPQITPKPSGGFVRQPPRATPMRRTLSVSCIIWVLGFAP